jgi:transposase
MSDTTPQRHPGGRPTTYRPEYVEQVVAVCAEGYSLTGFAGKIGVGRDTISEWAKVHPEFSAAVNRPKAARAAWWEERAREVAEKGGSGGQSTMVIFGLKNHAPEDYREKQEIEHSGSVGFAERLVAARARAQQTE